MATALGLGTAKVSR